jgi:hypothetical protein
MRSAPAAAGRQANSRPRPQIEIAWRTSEPANPEPKMRKTTAQQSGISRRKVSRKARRLSERIGKPAAANQCTGGIHALIARVFPLLPQEGTHRLQRKQQDAHCNRDEEDHYRRPSQN